MTNNSVQYGIITILKGMGIAEKALTKNASFYKDLGLDSLDVAEFIMEIEASFGIDIPALEAENIQTIREAISYIEKVGICE